MTLHDEEEKLFRRWRSTLPPELEARFVTDGAVDPESFQASPRKVLLALKEVNDERGGGWCLRKFLAEGGRRQTWNNVTRWLLGIRALPKVLPWREMSEISPEQRKQQLCSIAVINLKKTPGANVADPGAVHAAAERDGPFLREQFALYAADLVLLGGSEVTSFYRAQVSASTDWRSTARGVEYQEFAPGRFAIAFTHPEVRCPPNLPYFALVDACREIILGFS